MEARPPTYPDAERLDLVEDPHGHRVADPCRWLEDPHSAATVSWSAARDTLTRDVPDAPPGRAGLAATPHDPFSAGSVSVPLRRAGRAFFTRREPDGTERALLDPIVPDPTGNVGAACTRLELP